MHAPEVCEDDRLKLALNLAFSCSLRMGEMLGLIWDCVDISEEAIAESKKNKTVRVLKLPKTESSIRKVFLPKSVSFSGILENVMLDDSDSFVAKSEKQRKAP